MARMEASSPEIRNIMTIMPNHGSYSPPKKQPVQVLSHWNTPALINGSLQTPNINLVQNLKNSLEHEETYGTYDEESLESKYH